MCGIAGFWGPERAAPVLLECLYKLEYRGYDSAGLATVHRGRVWLKKDVGQVAQVQEKHQLDRLLGNLGIGHVRWATHGAVTQANAHPHLDCRGWVAVAHNGIIENYAELRRRLEGRHHFRSETDSEVISHLIEEGLEAGLKLEEAVSRAVGQLEGSYALLAISGRDPQKLVGVRYRSPLVVGLSEAGVFMASDLLSFSQRCSQAIPMDDGEMAVVTAGSVRFRDQKGDEVAKQPMAIEGAWMAPSRDGQEHFMLKEVLEEPEALRSALGQPREELEALAQEVKSSPHVVIIASGSSFYAGLLGRYVLSRVAGKSCEVALASEFPYLIPSLGRDSLVIAVSQSGETADVMEGVRQARSRGVRVMAITNVPGSLLSRSSHGTLYLNCGPEVGVAASKTFLCEASLFYLLAFAMAGRLVEGQEKLHNLSHLVQENILSNGLGLRELARLLKEEKDIYFIARGGNLAPALEGALKLKEICYVHAEGMPAGELKHGTLALIEEGVPVLALCPRDDTYREMLGNVMETKARGAWVIGVSDEANDAFHHWVKIPRVEEVFYPLAAAPSLHLLAYHLAAAKGLNPDRPRNLAKSVTVK